MILLSIFASDAIALPLSPAFPTGELQYILDNSSAKVLIATEKYAEKAGQVLKTGLKQEPMFEIRRNPLEGAAGDETVQLKDLDQPSSGGLMLYTSGTTNRPVRHLQQRQENLLIVSRKAFSSPTLRSQHKQSHSSRPGNTRLQTVYCTYSLSTTSTAW